MSINLYFFDWVNCFVLNYVLLIILLQLSWVFPLLAPLHQNPPLHQAVPHPCSCPRVMCVRSLATPFPILYFTSPWLFCNYLFVLLNPLTSHPFSHILPSHLFIFTLTFGILIMMWLGVGLLVSNLFGTLCFLDLHVYILHQIREDFFHYFFK